MLVRHLNPTLFSKDVEQVPTRNGYGEGLVEAGKKDPNVVVLCADLTESTRSLAFKQAFPDRFVQLGVHEQVMALIGAGLALGGKVPFISSYAAFSPGRNWEQIRTNIALNHANVKIAGAHAGISVGPDGATHQALEDLATTRAIPGMVVLAPCDVHEARRATIAAAAHRGPVYLRFAREKTPVVTTNRTPFRIGCAEIFRTGRDATIVACGPLVYETLLAAECLAGNTKAIQFLLARYPTITARIRKHAGSYRHGPERKQVWTPANIRALLKRIGRLDIEVINSPSVKPLDAETIVKSAKKTGRVVTVEEHQITGGLFGAVAETLGHLHPTSITPIGMPNSFGESGEPMELLEKYGMTAPYIMETFLRS
ncbi:transketolase family protein [Candidatus Uhrbacteria bacterium]|nr:transketolase family protein [Candidatus Uhrbacteria bacterium]